MLGIILYLAYTVILHLVIILLRRQLMQVFEEILAALKAKNQRININGLCGAAPAFLLSKIWQTFPEQNILVLAATPEQARAIYEDLLVFVQPQTAKELFYFPEPDVLPYTQLSPEPRIWSERLRLLYEIAHGQKGMMVAPIAACLRYVPPKFFVANCVRYIHLAQQLDREDLIYWLLENGYTEVSVVEDVGEFAKRGGILDIWSPTTQKPIRFELEGDKIISLREFDPVTQRSKKDLQKFSIIPVRDVPLNIESCRLAIQSIQALAQKNNFPEKETQRLIEYLNDRVAFSGIETFLSLFHGAIASLFDFLPPDTLIVTDDPIELEQSVSKLLTSIHDLAKYTTGPERLIAPERLYLSWEKLGEQMNAFQQIKLGSLQVSQPNAEPEKNIKIETFANTDLRPKMEGHIKDEDPLRPLVKYLKERSLPEEKIVFTCHTSVQAQRLKSLFQWQGIDLTEFTAGFENLEFSKAQFKIRIAKLSGGFRWPELGISIITDEELFGTKVVRKVKQRPPAEFFTSFSELVEGDYLVHDQHGIGRYLGLKNLNIDNHNNDFILLEYLEGDKLYLPVYRLNLLQKYIGPGDSLPLLDKLGGTRWVSVQEKAKKDIVKIAKELLHIYASRQVHPGFKFPPPDAAYEEFSASFPYDETPDQKQAIDDVLRDMELEIPMDRLICGDVGYGKTEVAMRAAFKAIMAGKQVAILVPTTLLAFQHYENFRRRFEETPIKVEMLSRFRSSKEQKAIIEELKKGIIDIVIGTHCLLQKGIGFRDLGLLVIDEEQRFGVSHKEKMKKLRTTVDCLTLTATPIPRTLHLSLTGIRDISIINTPPLDRLAISTEVVPFDDGIIRHAIREELARDGQIFFVHNRVQTIRSMEEYLSQLLPEAKIGVAHGQLKERQLEEVMTKFIKKDLNVLLTTSIIESGLDIPSANTIIINRADTFGLAQLYQIRGRIGRSNRRAFAYLLLPQDKTITPTAKKRLTVLQRFTDLGSGFQISMHDLEIRGSGNILGSAQSGHVAAIGYEMYTKLLAKEIGRLQGKKIETEIDPDLNLAISAYLPPDYVEDSGTRLDIYRRLASRINLAEIKEMEQEIEDRFGGLPEEAKNLLGVMEIKVMAKELRTNQITFDGRTFSGRLDKTNQVDLNKLAQLISRDSQRYILRPPDRILYVTNGIEQASEIIKEAKNFLRELGSCVSTKQ
ncbi:MAG: transcription-repair coupling factor [Pseudomonadota bacterium]